MYITANVFGPMTWISLRTKQSSTFSTANEAANQPRKQKKKTHIYANPIKW